MKFTLEQLIRLCQLEKLKIQSDVERNQQEIYEAMVQALVKDIVETGIKQFANLLSLNLLQVIAAREEPDEVNRSKKPVLQRRIKVNCAHFGTETYLESLNLDKSVLVEIIKLMGAGN